MRAVDDAGVRPIVDGEVEGLGLGAPLRIRAGIRLEYVHSSAVIKFVW